jgi:tetratricopeptide (TPR) repeat protein
MPNDLGATLARVRASLDRTGAAVLASKPVAVARRNPRRTVALAAGAVLLMAAGFWLGFEGLPDWAPFAPKTFQEVARAARERPSDAVAQRELGHAQFAAGRRARALRSYDRALSLDSGVADDRLIGNAVATFGRKEQPRAEGLIAKHQLAAAAKGLDPLTRSRRYAVRWGAVRTLRKLGKDSRSAYVHAYVADLSSEDCDVRRRAMEKLGQVGDRSALSAVRRAKEEDRKTGGWFRQTCLGDREEATEKAILARR